MSVEGGATFPFFYEDEDGGIVLILVEFVAEAAGFCAGGLNHFGGDGFEGVDAVCFDGEFCDYFNHLNLLLFFFFL